MFRSCFYLALMTAPAGVAWAQDTPPAPAPPPEPTTSPAPSKSRRLRLGVQLGFTRFSSKRTSDTFGGNGFSISPLFGAFRRGTTRGEVRPDFDLSVSSRNSNTLVLLPLGVRYAQTFGEGRGVPYLGASVNVVPAYSKIKTLSEGGKFSVAGGASVFAGYGFGEGFNLEARYYAISKVRGYSPSNFQITAGVLF